MQKLELDVVLAQASQWHLQDGFLQFMQLSCSRIIHCLFSRSVSEVFIRLATVCLITQAVSSSCASEFRGLWVDAFHPGFKNSAEVRQLIQDARNANFNALIVEVRKRGDAYYQSVLVPKANDIAADYDPLADLIRQAHDGSPRLEVHAWTVMFPIWNAEMSSPIQFNHVINQHRDWLIKNNRGETWDGHNYQLDPGHPLVQEHLFRMAIEIITQYDIDGLHLDYIRYPGSSWGYNAVSLKRHQTLSGTKVIPSSNDPAWMQFRRDQVSALVRRIYLNALAIKPQLKISAATITHAPGISSNTQWSGSSAYSSVMQDWLSWMNEGILDLNIPMTYFRQTSNSGDWALWNSFVKDHAYQRQVAIGVGAYLNTASNALYQFRLTRNPSANGNRASGLAAYSYANICTNTSRQILFNALVNPSGYDPQPIPIFFEAAEIPGMPWKTNGNTGHLLGHVSWAHEYLAVDGAVIEISGPVQRTMRSDGAGFYGFVDLPAGNYALRVYARGSETNQVQLTIQSGKVESLDLKVQSTTANEYQHKIKVSPGMRNALISWQSPALSQSSISYGETQERLTNTVQSKFWLDSHSFQLSNLNPNTTYFLQLASNDGFQNHLSSLRSFKTTGEIIVDNPDVSPEWISASLAANKFGSNYHYASTTSSVNPATAILTPLIQTPGFYDVYFWYSEGSNRSAKAIVETSSDSGIIRTQINQTIGGGAWRLLAKNIHLTPETPGFVRLGNNTGESGKVVIADAARWVYVTGQDPAPFPQVAEWWARHFFNQPVSGLEDADQDGFTDLSEYLWGTDPKNSQSQLGLNMQVSSAGSAAVNFYPAYPNRSYQLLKNTVLEGHRWELLSFIPSVNSSWVQGNFTVPTVPDFHCFYRVQVSWK